MATGEKNQKLLKSSNQNLSLVMNQNQDKKQVLNIA